MIEQQRANANSARYLSKRTERLGRRTILCAVHSSCPAEIPPEMPSVEQEGLLLEHLPIVRFLARRIHAGLPRHVDMDDLVSAGTVGLMDAFTKFDPEKRVQFGTYAQFRVRGAILDSLRKLDWSPRDLRRRGRAAEEAVRALCARLGRLPDESEVATEMGVSLKGYQSLLGDLQNLEIGTLHVEHHEGSGEEEPVHIPGNQEEDPLSCCLRSELKDTLIAAIGGLPERERLVMTLRYFEELTMREIGLALSVGESRASQIHTSAVIHLQAILHDPAAQVRSSDSSRHGRNTEAEIN